MEKIGHFVESTMSSCFDNRDKNRQLAAITTVVYYTKNYLTIYEVEDFV